LMFDVSCFMFHVSCFIFHVSCLMFDVLCLVFDVWCSSIKHFSSNSLVVPWVSPRCLLPPGCPLCFLKQLISKTLWCFGCLQSASCLLGASCFCSSILFQTLLWCPGCLQGAPCLLGASCVFNILFQTPLWCPGCLQGASCLLGASCFFFKHFISNTPVVPWVPPGCFLPPGCLLFFLTLYFKNPCGALGVSKVLPASWVPPGFF